MNRLHQIFVVLIALFSLDSTSRAAVIVRDTWADGDRLSGPVSVSNTVWYASSSTSLIVSTNSMLGTDITEPRLWLAYFTEDPAQPVDLAVGQMIKVTLVFTPTNIAAWSGSGTGRGLRFGLFSFADGGTRLTADDTFGPGTDSGENVTGYMLLQSFYTNFSVDRPTEIRVRNNVASANLMGSLADYPFLRSSQAGYSNASGFVSGTKYTLEFSVARTATNSVDIHTSIVGGALNLPLSLGDITTNQFHRFDCFAIRPNLAGSSAESFAFSEFKVEVLTLPLLNPSFTKITTGDLVTEPDNYLGAAWGDYDGDGFIDLLITNVTNRNTFLYHNERNGTFSKITAGPIVADVGPAWSAAWADYDNDGLLDLFLPRGNEGLPLDNHLYRNIGGGAFQKITTGAIVNDGGQSLGCSWADYDRDGYLDLFVANGFGGQKNFLYHNNGDGSFTKITAGEIVNDLGDFGGGSWGDYDNDGNPDLFAPSYPPFNDVLYRNNGNGTFTKITIGDIVNESGYGNGSAWGDYNNDGFLDLFVANGSAQDSHHSFLYRNNQDGTFTKIVEGEIANDAADGGSGCSWVDFDNDGWLDLFVTTPAPNRSARHRLYRNNTDGTFTKLINTYPISDGGDAQGSAWGDYDNDGFLDLIVATGGFTEQQNFLYRNNGNSNRWITIKLVGAASNRSAVGAKVRLKATIGGRTFWQMREISAGNGFTVQNDMRAAFGLGNATNIDAVRIEWPSGTVQELPNVAANQFLTVTEPPRLQAMGRQPNGSFQFLLTGGVGFRYALETSSNLTAWTPWMTVTNTSRTITVSDPSPSAAQQFYHAVMLP